MKVKIGDHIYDGNDQPVMVILSEGDKFNISHMAPEATKYCHYPSGYNSSWIEKWAGEEAIKATENITNKPS